MSFAQLLIIGEGDSPSAEAVDIAQWHQEHQVWLCSGEPEFDIGTPVVARMAGDSNELLLDGLVAGPWAPCRFTDWKWEYEISIIWSRHVIRGVQARDVLPDKGTLRSSHIGLSSGEWSAIQHARYRAWL